MLLLNKIGLKGKSEGFKPLSPMVELLVNIYLHQFGWFYFNKNITNAKLHKFLQIDKRSQNLDNPKKKMNCGTGLSIGQLTLPCLVVVIN